MLRAVEQHIPCSLVASSSSTDARICTSHQSVGHPVEPFEQIRSIFSAGMATFFDKMADGYLRNDTGLPVITSYRINPVKPGQPDQFSIDIKCKFRWTNHPGARIRIHVFTALELLPDFHRSQQPLPEEKQPKSLFDQLSKSITSISIFRPDFNVLLKSAEETEGIHNKEAICLKACRLAETNLQLIAALEVLINALGDYHLYLDKLCVDGTMGKEERDLLQDTNLQKINCYMTYLPINYHLHTPSALTLFTLFKQIFALIQENSMDEAWELYQPASIPSPFISHAFPHLLAMNHQLRAIFLISRHEKMYGVHKLGVSAPFLPEVYIIEHTLFELNGALDALSLSNAVQKEQLKELSIAPILHLQKMGMDAASETSNAERYRLCEQSIREVELQRSQGQGFTFRISGEDMDADDEPRFIEINEGDSPCQFS